MLLKPFNVAFSRLIPSRSFLQLQAAIPGKYSFPTYSFLSTNLLRRTQHTATQDVVEDTSESDKLASKALTQKVNNHIANGPGRLFAIIKINAKQYKVVEQDLILLERNWPPEQGDELIFEKVFLVGGASFTLIGRPILPRNLVTVTGTVVHKDLTHTKLHYFTIKKKRVHRLNFVREELTYLRINKIEVHPEIDDPNTTRYLRG